MVTTYTLTFASPTETQRFAEQLAERLQAGDIIALEGDLGAGKTTFAQGLARGLGITETVNSPTFTVIKEYSGRLPLYHMDVYRVADDVEQLGLDDYFYGAGVCVVEWASLIAEEMPPERLTITLLHAAEQNQRLCRLQPQGSRYQRLCEELTRDAHTGH